MTPNLPKGYQLEGDIKPPPGYILEGPPQSLAISPPKEFGIAKVAKEALPDALPMIGGAIGDIPGAAIGALLKQVISPSKDLWSAAGEVAGDTALQGLLPSAIGKVATMGRAGIAKILANKFVGKIFPSVGEAVTQAKGADVASQFMKPEVNTIQDAAAHSQYNSQRTNENIDFLRQLTPDTPAIPAFRTTPSGKGVLLTGTKESIHPDVQAAITNRDRVFGEDSIGGKLNKVNPFQVGASDTSVTKIADSAMEDVTQARNFKFATGGDQQFTDLASSRAIRAGYVPGGKFDANKIIDELNGPKSDVYNEMNPQVKQNLSDVVSALKSKTLNKNATINYIGHRIAFALPAVAFGGGLGTDAAIGGSLLLGDYALGKIASDPIMSKLIVAGTKNAANTQSGSFIQKAIAYNLPRVLGEGAKLVVKNSDGEEDDAVVKDGKITYPPKP